MQRTPYTHQEREVLLPQSGVEAVVSQRPLVERVDEGGVCSAGADVGEVGAVGREGGWGRRLLGFRVQRSEYPCHTCLYKYQLQYTFHSNPKKSSSNADVSATML